MGSCSGVTSFTGGPIQIVGTLPPPGSPGAAPVFLPFAAVHYPMVGSPDSQLQTALNEAHASVVAANEFGSNSHVAFSLILLATDGNHKYAGIFDNEMHFSASLVKVAAMYSAHELLAAARRLAKKKGFADAQAFFAALSSTFNPLISATAVPAVRNLVVDSTKMGPAPKYDLIFAVTNLGAANEPDVEFSTQFQADLLSMIGHGTNDGASRCIRKLSYSYINAALIKGGFFNPSTPNGIWLAADYLGDKNKPEFNDATHIPYVRIDCLNDCITSNGVTDCKVGQIATTRLMCNLFALIELGKVPSGDTKFVTNPEGRSVPDTNLKMQTLLNEPKPIIPGSGGLRDIPWVDASRMLHVAPQFNVIRDKIGVAGLKRGPLVHSEGLVVRWINRLNSRGVDVDAPRLAARNISNKIVVCWQNLVGPPPAHDFDGIARIINQTFSRFIQ
jgi:hypothetical protein